MIWLLLFLILVIAFLYFKKNSKQENNQKIGNLKQKIENLNQKKENLENRTQELLGKDGVKSTSDHTSTSASTSSPIPVIPVLDNPVFDYLDHPEFSDERNVVIPEGYTEIGEASTCWERIILPSTLIKIGNSAFAECSNLKQIDFSKCKSLKEINEQAFRQCEKITEIVLPDSLTFIGERAFCGCYQLKKVILPASLVEIGESAFESCSKLNKIDFLRCTSLKKIDDSAFHSCEKLSEIVLPDCLMSIGEDAFSGCNLQRITLPSSLEEIGRYALGNDVLENLDMSKVTKLETIPRDFCGVEKQLVIPQGVITIEKDAIFSGKELFLPSSLKRYKDNHEWPIIYLFASDFNLESILWMDDDCFDSCIDEFKQIIYVLPQYLKNYIDQAKALGYRHADSIILPMPDEYLFFYDN